MAYNIPQPDSVTAELNKAIPSKIENLDVDAKTTIAENTITAIKDQIRNTINFSIDTIVDIKQGVVNVYDKVTDFNVDGFVGSITQQAQDTIQSKLSNYTNVASQIKDVSTNITSSLQSEIDSFQEQIPEQVESSSLINSSLRKQSEKISQISNVRVRDITTNPALKTSYVNDIMNDVVDESVNEIVNNVSQTNLGSSQQQLINDVDTTILNIDTGTDLASQKLYELNQII
jgi:hypothetical protein